MGKVLMLIFSVFRNDRAKNETLRRFYTMFKCDALLHYFEI